MQKLESDTDIEFDRYGDISFLGNDISFLFTDKDYLYQNVIDRIITNFNDYFLYPNYGANLSFFIGSTTNAALEQDIIRSIKKSLTIDNFLTPESIDIATMIDFDSILIKIQIGGDIFGISERIIINSVFNTSSGLFYVTN